jgi:hypothetical protein
MAENMGPSGETPRREAGGGVKPPPPCRSRSASAAQSHTHANNRDTTWAGSPYQRPGDEALRHEAVSHPNRCQQQQMARPCAVLGPHWRCDAAVRSADGFCSPPHQPHALRPRWPRCALEGMSAENARLGRCKRLRHHQSIAGKHLRDDRCSVSASFAMPTQPSNAPETSWH